MWIFIIIAFIIIVFILSKFDKKQNTKRQNALNWKLIGIEDFQATKKIEGYKGFYIFAIDEKNEKISLITEFTSKTISFSDIIGVELVEDGNTISKKSTTRSIGGAIIGGVLAGGAGSIIGGLSGSTTQKNTVSSLSVKILLRNIENPNLVITCFDAQKMTIGRKKSIKTEGETESYIYKICKKNADEIKDLTSIIIDKCDRKAEPNNQIIEPKPSIVEPKSTNLIADELMKLNELKEKGIITEDEFLVQKQKILS